jgi:hypothetical protein
MKALLHVLLRRPQRHCAAIALGTEKRLHLVSGHYCRERVSAFLWRAHCRPVTGRMPPAQGKIIPP